MHNSNEMRYTKLKQCLHDSYINGEYNWPKKLSDTLNMILNWKGEKRSPIQKYKYTDGMDLMTKGNTGGFRGDFYSCGKYGHMDQDFPEPRK